MVENVLDDAEVSVVLLDLSGSRRTPYIMDIEQR
jgi:hypothetical protein